MKNYKKMFVSIFLISFSLISCQNNNKNIEKEYFYINATYVSVKSEKEYVNLTDSKVAYYNDNKQVYNYDYRIEVHNNHIANLYHEYTYLLTVDSLNKKQLTNGCYMFTLKE